MKAIERGETMTFEKLMADSRFLAKLSEAKNMGEVQELFASEGVTVTEDQLMEFVLPAEDELDENALECVAGGSGITLNPFLHWVRNRFGKRSGGGGGHRF